MNDAIFHFFFLMPSLETRRRRAANINYRTNDGLETGGITCSSSLSDDHSHVHTPSASSSFLSLPSNLQLSLLPCLLLFISWLLLPSHASLSLVNFSFVLVLIFSYSYFCSIYLNSKLRGKNATQWIFIWIGSIAMFAFLLQRIFRSK